MEDKSDINSKISSPQEKLGEQFVVFFRIQFPNLGLHVGLMNKRHLKEKQNNLYILFFSTESTPINAPTMLSKSQQTEKINTLNNI